MSVHSPPRPVTRAARPPGGGPVPRTVSNGLVSAVAVTTLSAVLVLLVPNLRHWLMVPVTIGGALVATDAVGWLLRRTDLFDPRACLGLFGFHFFYVAPVLQVALDHWMKLAYDPPDWPEAVGALATLNAVGLAVYRCVVGVPHRGGARRSARRLDLPAFHRIGLVAVVVSLLAFAAEVVMFGGLSGFLTVMTGTLKRPELAGLGWLIVVAEAFPMLVAALLLVRHRAVLARRPGLLLLLMLGLLVTQFVVGGLKGSRSTTLWPVLLCLMIVHLLVRRISRRTVCVLAVLGVAYLYGYGIYKTAGTDVLDIPRGDRSLTEMTTETGRDLPTLLTGDLGRTDVQAVLLDRHLHGDARPQGITYLGDLAMLVPRALLPERPPSKVEVGTNLVYGPARLEAGYPASKVYGLAGEAMMNFGPLGGVASFVVLGLVVRAVRRYYLHARRTAEIAPKLLAPLLWNLALLPLSDLDNTLWFMVKYAAPLALVVLLATRWRPGPALARSGPARPVAGRHRAAGG
ncbi:hypothetical protein [Micromonospora okii]|uniref:hypothetical protein n=1 Tax=Micromonospora okii TaxID=1182970 RepID=UPI001E51527D|nr:hypothetical protein [Micromonospora okii]